MILGKVSFFFLFLSLVTLQTKAQVLVERSIALEKSLEAIEQNNHSQALLLINFWLEDHPLDSEGYWYRAGLYEHFKELLLALADYNSVLELNPDRGEAYMARGRLRYQLGQYERAKEDFKKFLVAAPGETSQIIYRRSSVTSGVSQILTAQTENPAQTFYHLGLCSIALSEYPEAIAYLDSAIFHDSTESDFFVQKGKALALNGNLEAARTSYEIALGLNQNHFSALQGLAFISPNEDETALEKLNHMIMTNQENPELLKQRGYLLLMQGDFKGSIDDFDQVLQKDTTSYESLFYRGKAKASLKLWGEAEIDYSKSMDIAGPDPKLFLARGQSRYQIDELEGALADFSLAIFYDPEAAAGYYHRGITYHRLKKLDNACQDLNSAIELGMKDAEKVWEIVCSKRN
jgi:tetratricopeptide (TPR) repeat protein